MQWSSEENAGFSKGKPWMPVNENYKVVNVAEEEKEFTDKDLKALEAYCTNYAKWQKCEQIIDEKGYSMEVGDNGYEQQRPEVSIANKAQTEMRAWAKELGLTPAARQRMKAENTQGESGIDAELDGMIAHD